MNQKTAAYGSWQSPITAAMLAQAGRRFVSLQCSGDAVYWVELRPSEGGRYVIVRRAPDGTTDDITPKEYNARTLVHEYGGGMAAFDEGTVYFSNFTDQALYRQDGAETPARITPTPLTPLAQRYADGRITPDGKSLVYVREVHLDDGTVINEIVVLPADGNISGEKPSRRGLGVEAQGARAPAFQFLGRVAKRLVEHAVGHVDVKVGDQLVQFRIGDVGPLLAD